MGKLGFLFSGVQIALERVLGTGRFGVSLYSGFGNQQLAFSCQVADGFSYYCRPPIQLIEFCVLRPNLRISPAWLEAKDGLSLLYLRQFFLQIPYLFFEFHDHFPLGLATLTLGRRQSSTKNITRLQKITRGMIGRLHGESLQPFHDVKSKMIAPGTKDFKNTTNTGRREPTFTEEEDLPWYPISFPGQSPI